jgi:sortase A
MRAVRLVLRGTGELLLTTGLVLLLFVVYQLVWTNVEAERQQDRVAARIADDWRRPSVPAAEPAAFDVPLGDGFGFMRIPRLGETWKKPLIEGVRARDLSRGVGHYPGTTPPGEVGNFAVAGHRTTNGQPFHYLDRIRRGDAIVVETEDEWLTYVVDRKRIVRPSDVWVIDAVPGRPEAEPTRALLTITTCHPRWASTERLIVFSHLTETTPKPGGPPAVLRAGA